MKDLGAAKKILGMQISRGKEIGKLHLSQKGYVEKVLTKFIMQKTKTVSTPLAAYFKFSLSLSLQCSGLCYVCYGLYMP